MKFSFMVIGYVAERKALYCATTPILFTEYTQCPLQREERELPHFLIVSLPLAKLTRKCIFSIVHLW